MSEFKNEPKMVLEDMEAVRKAIAEDYRTKMPEIKFEIKSLWIIELINEIIASRPPRQPAPAGMIIINIGGDEPVAYNAEIKALAEQRLGFPKKSDAEYAREGDALSALIYAAQGYRRSDKLKADGYVPCTQELIDRLGVGKKLETPGGTVYAIRKVGDKLYAMKPRIRKSALATSGNPVKVVQ